MSASLALKVSRQLGISLSKARRFVTDVGPKAADDAVSAASRAGSRTISKWWKPAAGTGVIVGGGSLAWRQQDIERAKAIADQERSASDALTEIMESDLSPEQRRDLVEQWIATIEDRDTSSDDDTATRIQEWFDDFFGGGGMQSTLILLVVVVLIVTYAINEMEGGAGPNYPVYGGMR